MADGKINIKIEKNNYKSGSLDFWIYNSEADDYDEKNAFSDENRLLKYTSETRDLADYADELIKMLLYTYRRMKGIEVEFFGELSDYNVLREALNKQTQDSRYVIIPHCDMDPSGLYECLNKYIVELNSKLSSDKVKNQFEKTKELTEIDFEFNEINPLSEKNDARELLTQAEIAIDKMNELFSDLEKYGDSVYDKCYEYEEALDSHNNEINEFKESLSGFYMDIAEQYPTNTSHEFESIFDDIKNKVVNRYENKSKLNASSLKEYTQGIAEDMYRFTCDSFSSKTAEICNEIYRKSSSNVRYIISDFYNCSFDTIKIGLYFCNLNEVIENAYDRLVFLQWIIDFGEIKIFKDVRLKGVTENYIKKERITFNVDTKKYMDNFDISFYYESVLEFGLDKAAEAFSKNVKVCLDSLYDKRKEGIESDIKDCKEQLDLVNSLLSEIAVQKKNIESHIKAAKEGGC